MNRAKCLFWALLCASALVTGCGGSGGGVEGSFSLVQFLEAGKDSIPRNRVLTFKFSAPVATTQDFAERLKIQNFQTGQGQSDFSRAIGNYVVSGDTVTFAPRLPEKPDRSDSGFRASGEYHVFLKAGPDSLTSTDGDVLGLQQEFIFGTDENFEDTIPADPPRALRLLARDVTTNVAQDLSRLDPSPVDLALLDTNDLVSAGAAIEPGAGGPPQYDTRWQLELHVTEPLDPQTVNENTVEMFEIRDNAFDNPDGVTATPGHVGDAVSFRTPVRVDVVQRIDETGVEQRYIRVRPIQTLVDNARYRIVFSGNILGIDFRKQFIGDNGLTGDGQILTEPGGLGYVAEFVVFNRPAISATRTLTYDPAVDDIFPETGKTTTDETLLNTALYNPASDPGRAVGFLAAFGSGEDGSLAVSGGNTVILNTGDVVKPELGNTFNVLDLNPDNQMNTNTFPGKVLQWGGGATDNGLPTGNPVRVNPEPFELELDALTVSSSSTLRVVGKNPLVLRVAGVVQIVGQIDLSGGNGMDGGGSVANAGEAGAGGFPGGSASQGDNTCSYRSGSCTGFQSYLNNCAAAKNLFPISRNGEGPGRGMAGGEMYTDYSTDETNHMGGSGGGGGSHATAGTAGEDRGNGSTLGTQGTKCSNFVNVRMAGFIGVRGQPGDTYGDQDVSRVFLGGSGGGAGGGVHVYNFGTNQQAGGAGGGGGGSISIVASGTILAAGGLITAAGGDGGKGALKDGSTSSSFVWNSVSGGGGGGAGGSISLISGDDINLTAAVVSTAGGAGGERGNVGTATTCNACNAGGEGGKGFIFLMDADGEITGLLDGSPGDYDTNEGLMRVSAFDTTRFNAISAVTELFPMPAADPTYQALAEADILANVNPSQSIELFASSARADAQHPLSPDLTPGAENPAIHVATVSHSGVAVVVEIKDPMTGLNPGGVPNREAFVRIRAVFDYDNGVEAALGPFAAMDEMTISIAFNG